MKTYKRLRTSILAVIFIAASCLFPCTAFAEETEIAAEKVIYIKTAGQLQELSKNCMLDAWSRDKKIILTADMDLSGLDFAPIPIFGGHFDGNGHKISGLAIDGETSYQGLFRFVEEGGLVENLTVSGTVKTSGAQEYVGGIAGSAGGTIRNCAFEGSLDAGLYVGGIAGITEKTGRVEACLVSGTVQGKKYTGGITGQNDGIVERCENRARVNPSADDEGDIPEMPASGVKESALEERQNAIDNLRSLEASAEDTGGIAGFSRGTIKDCSNTGKIGYPHVGYNVGGIAGRSMGYLSGCSNSGIIRGRKDVGGIVGQMAPNIQLVFSSDTLDRLSQELDAFSAAADSTLDHTDGNRGVISDRLSQISDQAKTASDQTSELADLTVDWADSNIEEINEAMDMLEDTVNRMRDISGTLESVLGTMDDGIQSLEDAMDEAGDALGIGKRGEREFRAWIQELRGLNQEQKENIAEIGEQSKALLASLAAGDVASASNASESIKANLDDVLETAAKYKESVGEVSEAAADLPDIGIKLRNGAGDLSDALDSIDLSLRDLEDVSDELYKMFRDLSRRDQIRFLPLGDEIQDKGDQVHGSVRSIGDQMELLQAELDEAGDTFSDDIRDLKDQLEEINRVLDDAREEAREKDEESLWEDVSEAEIQETTTGKAKDCRNTGAVEGDINTGGIAGAMAIERDLDPEDDIEEIGQESLNFRYETRAILENCQNEGAVTGKMDCAGGAVGKMSLGYILGCRNYGNVESTDGNFVGGIAGSSASTIRGSYSKCMVSGENFVGGIAGDSYRLYNNVAFVSIQNSEMYAGAVAGRADGEGELSRNRFVDCGAAGVDGISYAGKAEPVAYEDLLTEPGTPEEFGRLYLSYVAGDVLSARVSCYFGDRFSELSVPEVPEKKGYVGVWEEPEEETVMFDRVFRAVYTPCVTTVASVALRGPVRPVLLAEGMFDGSTTLVAEKMTEETGKEQWRISLTGESQTRENGSYRFRFIPPAEWKRMSLTILTENGEIPVTWTKDQSACVFETSLPEFVLLCENTGQQLKTAVSATAAVVSAAVVGMVVCRRRKKQESS